MFVQQRIGGQVSLRSPGHSKNLSNALSKARKDNFLCDIVLIIGGKRYNAHKIVLSSCSDYFKAMFSAQTADATKKEITIPSIVTETFDQLMEYFYEGQLHIDMVSVFDLLHASSLFLLKDVEQQCYTYLKDNINTTNCVQIKVVSELFPDKDLVAKVNSYVEKNFEKIALEKEFNRLTLKNLKALLSSNNIMCKSEDTVVDVIERWLEIRPLQEVGVIKSVVKSIRYPFLSKDCLDNIKNFMKEMDKRFEVSYHHSILESEIKKQNRPQKKLSMKCRKAHRLEDVLYYLSRSGEAFCYNLSTKKSYHLPTCHFIGASGALAVDNNKVYICGGTSDSLLSPPLKTLHMFDPAVNRWKSLASMKFLRRKHCIVFLDGKLYVIGGTNHSDPEVKRSVECYDPVNDAWSEKPSTTVPRVGSSVAASDKFIYVVAGEGYEVTTEKYCPLRDKWLPLPKLNERRVFSSAVYFKERLYVFGMNDRSFSANSFEILGSTDKSWMTVKSPYDSPVSTALVINDKIITIGGSSWGEDLCLQYSFVRRRGVNSSVLRDFIHPGHRYKYFRYGVLKILNYDLLQKSETNCDCNYSDDSESDNDMSDSMSDDDLWLDHDPFGLWL